MDPPPSRPIPGLDNARVVAWIDPHRVIFHPQGSHTNDAGLNLDTGKALALPGHRPMAFGSVFKLAGPRPSKPRPTTEQQYGNEQNPPFFQFSAVPSPDGRWLLYVERAAQHAARFRLSSLRGEPDRLIPADGRFTLAPMDSLAWLPDSSGWIVVRCAIYEPIRLTRHRLKAPRVPEPLQIRGLPEQGDQIARFWVVQVTTGGELVLSDPDDWRRLHLIDVVRGDRVRSVYLRTLAEMWTKYQQDSVGFDGMQLSPDGQYLLAGVREGEKSWSAWRLPLEGSPPQRLFTLDKPILGLFLAPDGKTLVYRVYTGENHYTGGRAYLTTLPWPSLSAR